MRLYLLVITITGIVLAEVFAMIVVYFVRHWEYHLQVAADAAIMVVIIFPLIYFLLVRPLSRGIIQRTRSESILQARLRLMQLANNHSMERLLQLAIDEIEILTGSTIGFFHFISADQKIISLQAWSTNTLEHMCQAEGKGAHYDLEKGGVWADAVRQRQPIIHNNYAALTNRKGLPEGHAHIVRELVVPILREEKVVGILGIGNKKQNYTAEDVELAYTFADFAWDIIEHIRAETAISTNEAKFRTLVDWTYDWELWRDQEGRIVYTSPSCERITGYSPQEFMQDPELVIRIIHPEDREWMRDHDQSLREAPGEPVTIEFRIIARDGSEHWIEHRCRPLFDSNNSHLGRRISNRDITDQKQIEKKMQEQVHKEQVLTHTIHNLQADIGRDLHDTLGNQISFLRMNLEHLSESQWSDPARIRTQIQQMAAAANASYEMVRAMLAVFQAGDLSEPLSLFSRYAEQIAERSSLTCEITSRGEPWQLSLSQLRQLYYIFQEALGNIEKYARAQHISVTFIWERQCLQLVISDDGVGFALDSVPASGHYGLKFMRERAVLMNGSLEIQPVLGQGTTLTVTVPSELTNRNHPVRQN